MRLITSTILPSSREVKFPHADTFGNVLHISGVAEQTTALYWSKQDRATSFPNPIQVGDSSGKADWSATDIAVGTDGTVYYAWIDQGTGEIKLRRKAPSSATFGAESTVVRGEGFKVNMEMDVTTNNTVFVVWRVPDKPFRYRFSTDGGGSWSGTYEMSNEDGLNYPAISTGPNNSAMIVYGTTRGVIYVATWNGTIFGSQQISNVSGYLADPSGAIAPDGRRYATWRRVGGGVYFAEQQRDGAWRTDRLAGAEAIGPVGVSVDSLGNQHVTWFSAASGSTRLYYAFRSVNSANFEGPLEVGPPAGAVLFNARSAANVSDAAYNHVVVEQFSGSGLDTRYYLFAANGTLVSAEPKIEGGASRISRRSSVLVSFDNVNGNPNQVRWRWSSAPTDTANDSGGWVAFSNPLRVPLPTSLMQTGCDAVRLYTQVHSTSTSATEVTAKETVTVVDGGVQADVRVYNPYSKAADGVATTGLAAELADAGGRRGASDGDTAYTRVPAFYMELNGAAECSGIKQVMALKDDKDTALPFPVSGNAFANILLLPDAANASQGANSFLVRVDDTVGNVIDFTRVITYDSTKPILSTTPTLNIIPGPPGASLAPDLALSNVQVSDNLYPGRGYWGVWIAASRSEVADPITSTTLDWRPVVAPIGATSSFTITRWFIGKGLSWGDLTPGNYYVYVRFLDGAGNPSDGYASASIFLSEATVPTSRQPIVLR